MTAIEFAFDRPLLLLLFIPAAALILLPFFLLPGRRRRGASRIVPPILHCLIALLLCLILSGFSIVKVSDRQEVFLLLDLSYSTKAVEEEIKERTEELLSLIDKEIPVGVVVFGKDQIYDLKTDKNDRTLTLSEPLGEATDLEAALDYTASLLSEERASRILLLSDGKQNAGQAEDAAYRLANANVRVDAFYFDSTSTAAPEVQISSLMAPEGSWLGESCRLTCTLQSNIEATALLRLYEGETLIEELEVELQKGSTPAVFELIPKEAGICSFRAELILPKGKDTVADNNTARTFLKVSAEQHLLVLVDTLASGEALKEILSQDLQVTVKRTFDAPKTLPDLCKYDGVVLANADYHSLPSSFTRLITDYVGVHGRSLILAGGESTFMFGGMEDTVLEELSPVEFKIEESPEGATVALMLVLDCSSSMNSTYLSLAKQGAIKSLESLAANDQAGVISFNSKATLHSPLIPASAENKEELTRLISGIETGRGTFYTEALALAAEELLKTDADIRHILFLSDGQPSDSGYYSAVLDANEQGITVSTIGLAYSSSILDYMAYYGKGRYHYVDSVEDLPEIMLSEAEQARINPTITGEIAAVVKRQSTLTAAIDPEALPPLAGYLATTAKEQAEIYLTTEKGHPLFAVAEYGYGKVSCFASDLSGDWSRSWFSNSQGQLLLNEILRFTRPKIHRDTTLIVKSEPFGNALSLTVNTPGVSKLSTVTVLLTDPDGKEITKELSLKLQGLYEGVFPVEPDTVYKMTVIEKNAVGAEIDRTDGAVALSWCTEYDAFAPSGKDLLVTLCNLTGGQLLEQAEQGAEISLSALKVPTDPAVPLLVICGLLFLIDTALRLLRFKELKERFYAWQAKKNH